MGRDGLSVIEKAAAVLRCFLDARTNTLTFAEVLAATPLSRATAHRVLADLTANGLLAQDAQREVYRLGPLLLSVGGLARQLTTVSERAIPRMVQLRDEFQETMVLAELRGRSVVPVQRIDGLFEMRMNQEIGREYPPHAGATGKVLLAHLASEEQAALLAGLALPALTDATVTAIDELRLELDDIRRSGVAVSRGERVPGAIAVSAPIFDGTGRLQCALTLSGVASRFDAEQLRRAALAVTEASASVSEELGHVRTAGEPRPQDLRDPQSEPYRLLRRMCAAAAPASAPS
jgi:DNA-binding IclR family transcriptional regulator